MAGKVAIGPSDVLIVVDVQNDFCPGGRLAVPRGDEVVVPINRLAAKFAHVVLTQDWHPPGHLSFASSHPGRRPFESIAMPYGAQGTAKGLLRRSVLPSTVGAMALSTSMSSAPKAAVAGRWSAPSRA